MHPEESKFYSGVTTGFCSQDFRQALTNFSQHFTELPGFLMDKTYAIYDSKRQYLIIAAGAERSPAVVIAISPREGFIPQLLEEFVQKTRIPLEKDNNVLGANRDIALQCAVSFYTSLQQAGNRAHQILERMAKEGQAPFN